MYVHVEDKTTNTIRKTPVLQQTHFWAEFKQQQGIGAQAVDIEAVDRELGLQNNGSAVHDDLLILFQHIGDGFHIGYVPYGPAIAPPEGHEGSLLEELSESLRPHLPKSCIALRYDLKWESPWAHDDASYTENGSWAGPPAKYSQEMRMNFPTQNWNLKKAHTDILPADTIFLDLHKSDEDLLMSMRPKTRYNIRLSHRKGVRVRRADLSEIGIWYALYSETCTRNGIHLHDIFFFESLFTAEMKDWGSAVPELLFAEVDGEPFAAMFLVTSGRRATYLYGASSTRNRNMMSTYALQWEAMKRAKAAGCTEYDMFGVAPKPDPSHPMYGLYRFKAGFGGSLFHRMGCWDYPLDYKAYETYLASEMLSQGYHL